MRKAANVGAVNNNDDADVAINVEENFVMGTMYNMVTITAYQEN
ncbi:uncharacterized protein G2W53_022454 [Senna tora]|uniref:Uncharacterized protein n=1 Tax=Senna tora TaxID=362788 RepID=A0A834TM10_9FABA|nr:uncharacterized protein G2W53_022454 [Senna tora]